MFSCFKAHPAKAQAKTTVTIRLDKATVKYFKNLTKQVNMPYQTLINSYLADCAAKKKKPELGLEQFEWQIRNGCGLISCLT